MEIRRDIRIIEENHKRKKGSPGYVVKRWDNNRCVWYNIFVKE